MRTIMYIAFLITSSLLLTLQRKKAHSHPDDSGPPATTFRSLVEKYTHESNTIKINALKFILSQLKAHGNDSISITEDYLQKNIDLACNACVSELSSGKISTRNFYEYVLPYRLDNEMPDNWRSAIIERFGKSYDSLHQAGKSLCQITAFFNQALAKGFRYGQLALPPELKNWKSLAQANSGDCFEMTHLITYVLRTFGIPTSFDYTPCWGNSNGMGHAWNVLISNDRFTPFMGLESDPSGHYSPFILIGNNDPRKITYRKCGKIFRRIFSENKSVPENDPVFKDEHFFLDVTGQYFHVSDLKYPDQNKSAEKFYYICSYNYGQWRPIFFGEKNKGTISFNGLANDMLYLPTAIDPSGNMEPIDVPVILKKTGDVCKLLADTSVRVSVTVKTLQSIEEDQLAAISRIKDWNSLQFSTAMRSIQNGTGRSRPIDGKTYELFYWDKTWRSAGSTRSVNNTLRFAHVPDHALYKILLRQDPNGSERPFTMEDGRQVWW